MFPSVDGPAVILAVVGSTELQGDERAYNFLENVMERYHPQLVVSGGARGIDTMAVESADRRGIPWREYEPDVQQWEGQWDLSVEPPVYLKGFKDRNLEIAEACTHLVRVGAKKSRTYGSAWTRDRAAQLGKPCEEMIIG